MQKKSVIIIFTVVALGLLAGGYFALRMATQENRPITSFEACIEAGNPVRESYPEVCATPDGQSFINPQQQLQSPL